MRKHHYYFRTLFASIFGSVALSLILASILVVWLNRTLIDTNTYVRTVAPLITTPDIQNFVADKVTDSLIRSAPPADLVLVLLPQSDIATKTPQQLQLSVISVASNKTTEQIQTAARPIVRQSVLYVVQSQDFQKQWRDTNRSAHAHLVGQLNGDAKQLTLDLSPLAKSIITELSGTRLAPISNQLVLPADAGKIDLKGGAIDKTHQDYKLFQEATIGIVAATVLAVGLCILLSVEHIRTARRILVSTGTMSLLSALLLQTPSFFRFHGASLVDQKATVAFAGVLFRDLQTSLIIIGVTCLVLAIGSKIYSIVVKRRAR